MHSGRGGAPGATPQSGERARAWSDGAAGEEGPCGVEFSPELMHPLLSSQALAPYTGLRFFLFLENASLFDTIRSLTELPAPCEHRLGLLGSSVPPKGFSGDSDGTEPTGNAGDLGSIPGLGRSPGGGHGNPLQYSCLENPHGQRSLAGYSPWRRKESDTNE